MGASPARILVVEFDGDLRRAMQRSLGGLLAGVDAAARGDDALALIAAPSEAPYDAVVTNLDVPGADGLEVLAAALARDPRTCVLVVAAGASVESAVAVMRAGAADFLAHPVDTEQLGLRLAAAVARRHSAARGSERGGAEGSGPVLRSDDEVVAESPALRATVELVRRVARTRSTVLLTGETGTGKEVMAGLVHRLSPRRDGPLVKVNCAALPETLLESELFGHERGAFTGADRQRVGRFEQASGGTLFLDEVGDMSPATQAKLLRVLQDQEFHRLGGSRILRTDVRIVAATNQDLESAIRTGHFREDLYFRLHVIRIHLPPLRERPEDLVALAERFVAEFALEQGRDVRGFSAGALERIRAHPWPGNVRELRNAIERAVLTSEGHRIEAIDLAAAPAGPEGGWPAEGTTLHDAERQLVLHALDSAGWVQKDAARLLGVSRRKLNYMIQRMGITHPRWRRNRAREPAGEASNGASGP